MAGSVSHNIARNSLFNVASKLLQTAVAIFLTPYILTRVSGEEFGTWAVIGAVAIFVGLSDLGISASILWAVAEGWASGAAGELRAIVKTAFTYFLAGSLLIAALGILAGRYALDLFDFGGVSIDAVRPALYLWLFAIALRNLGTAYRGALNGLQRMDLTGALVMAGSLVRAAATVAFLEAGWGLVGLAMAEAVSSFLLTLALALAAMIVVPELRCSPIGWRTRAFIRMFRYGIRVWVIGLAEYFNFYIDKLILGAMMDAGAVKFYTLGSRLADFAASTATQLLPAVSPAAVDLAARGDRERLLALYRRGSKYIALATSPLLFFSLAAAGPLLTLWLGAGYGASALALRILVIGYSAVVFNGVARLVARGISLPELEMRCSVAVSILNLVSSAVLTYFLGFIGAMIGTTASMLMGSVVFVWLFEKSFAPGAKWELARVLAAPLGAGLAAGAAAFWTGRVLQGAGLALDGRAAALKTLLAEGPVFAAVFVAALLATRCIGRDEWRDMRRIGLRALGIGRDAGR